MKTLEEPPYLTVGTDVSAKYRGAFCEAKIKTAKRLVKAKVTFKPDASTAVVHDEHIRGLLKVGAVVEARNQDGIYQEAIINKLTDASLYTVVFDDGDEKTLRRSSLCLKGARHFAESETLDRLPLTNPEHFGTPVIGKKGNRGGRRSNPIQEEESSSSSSEEEEGDQQQNEGLYGKVVCVDGVVTSDKKKTTWYPALVISPDCHEDVTLKKDNIFVRSFKDGKFYTVLRKDIRVLDEEKSPKADAGLKPALDAAWDFQRNGTVPNAWRTEVKDESSSSEDDDEEEEEEQEEEASREEEEEEVEPFPEEKDNFQQQLYKFMEDRGTPINKRPVLGYKNLNLFQLYRLVHKLGGFDSIESGSVWKQVYQDLGIPVLNSAAGYNVKCAYRKYLYGFEDYCTSTGITFRMDLPYKTGEKTSGKSEENTEETVSGGTSVSSSTEEEQKALKEPETSNTQHVLKEEKTETTAPGEDKADISSVNEEEDDDDDDNHADEEENDINEEAKECGPTAESNVTESVKEEPCEEPDSKDLSGYDEWVKADKIVRPANKNVPKIKHRKKIKNKAERERDRIERLTDREDFPLPRNRINRLSNPNSGSDVFSKMEDCGDELNQQTPVKPIEITSILNGLPGSESSTDDSEREDDDDADHDEEDHPGGRVSLRKGGPPERSLTPQHWETGSPSEGFKAPTVVDEEPTVQESPESGKRKSQFEVDVEGSGGRRKKAEVLGERSLKSPAKGKTRTSRGSDWLPSSSPKKLEERGPLEDRGESSSEDEATELQPKEIPKGHPKTKSSPSKKYNGVKEKNKSGCSGFWEIPEKRAKISTGIDDRSPSSRTKGQKDVWSSIQVQWPKKILKDLFSDSDTEAANSPPPPPAGTVSDEPSAEPARDNDEEEIAEEKLQENPSSGTNSVLNTPPTTPESPARAEGPAEVLPEIRAPSLPASPQHASLPEGPLMEERAGGRSESDSSTVEVESLGGEIPEIHREEEAGSPSKAFDGNLSCNSNSNCSLTLSNSSQQESEQKAKASSSQKRHKESQGGGASKKHKRSHKNLSLHPKKNRKPAHSSDSEDQCISESKSSSRTPPSAHRYQKHGEPEHSHSREHHARTRWTFQMSDLEKMSSLERIAFLQEKLQDIRNHYLSLKSEVASIDRRRKRMKKKERETGAAVASSSSSSSSPSSSSLTAAVMLTLAEPTVSGASQTSGVSVECR
ncbi:AT-rich interactive domain-containing protein 4B isoform X3 [Rhinichthys klamathensis goyatoka]|uniref:AT-rich interactive domain-containing protein 4B isoform X3 n=1 Tax=Rhinichthys klamathensis goyatoka TaxID=3034132 RepID=UPI0024B56BE9|nr:AT-rich interactive domain-containing protein 4B isoform X3 [Rhinichthys klamathensis goyatoka]